MSEFRRLILVFLLISGSTMSTSQDYLTYQVDHEIQVVAPIVGQSYDEVLKDMKNKALELKKINSDLMGYIYMHEYFEQPIMSNKGKGFSHYLRTDIYGKYSGAGTPFLSDKSHDTFEGNSLLYGHSSQWDKLFARILGITDQEIFDDAPPLIIYDVENDEFKIMKLFTILEVLDGVEFIQLDNMSEEERLAYNESIWQRSFFESEKPNLDTDVFYLQVCRDPSRMTDFRIVTGYVLLDTIPGT